MRAGLTRAALAVAMALAGPALAQTGEGWTLRTAPGGAPVAVGDGVGAVRTVAAFCLEGLPWLAIEFADPPPAEVVAVSFRFSSGAVEGAARQEAGAGGAYVIELADSPLAGLLAGGDSRAQIAVDGTTVGDLSLRGSSRAIGAALESCPAS